MARKLRLEYEGALYHVINRGNYRRDLFERPATAKAFEAALDEACVLHGWKLHAYVVMRNHYHLALETPQPNLVAGMHWLQSTFATRFNRFRSEHGHLFQGRYQSLLVEDWTSLARVVNYIHLNPVRAGIVAAPQVAGFRWSSLARFLKSSRSGWLVGRDWLAQLGLKDDKAGWSSYVKILGELARDPVAQKAEGFDDLCCGWSIGTAAWRRAIAHDHSHLELSQGVAALELKELKEARWTVALNTVLRAARKTPKDLNKDAKGAAWKISGAVKLRLAGAPHAWIAEALAMGSSNSVRSYVSRHSAASNQHLSG